MLDELSALTLEGRLIDADRAEPLLRLFLSVIDMPHRRYRCLLSLRRLPEGVEGMGVLLLCRILRIAIDSCTDPKLRAALRSLPCLTMLIVSLPRFRGIGIYELVLANAISLLVAVGLTPRDLDFVCPGGTLRDTLEVLTMTPTVGGVVRARARVLLQGGGMEGLGLAACSWASYSLVAVRPRQATAGRSVRDKVAAGGHVDVPVAKRPRPPLPARPPVALLQPAAHVLPFADFAVLAHDTSEADVYDDDAGLCDAPCAVDEFLSGIVVPRPSVFPRMKYRWAVSEYCIEAGAVYGEVVMIPAFARYVLAATAWMLKQYPAHRLLSRPQAFDNVARDLARQYLTTWRARWTAECDCFACFTVVDLEKDIVGRVRLFISQAESTTTTATMPDAE